MSCSWSRSLQIYEWLPEAWKIYLILFSWIISSISILSALLLMDELLHQVRLVVYPIIYRVLYIHPRWCRIASINSIIIPLTFQPFPPIGTQINGQDFLGNTPLHLAARIGTLVELGTVNVQHVEHVGFTVFCPCFLMKMSLDLYKPA